MTATEYATAHWRGRLSLPVSALLNGLALYLLLTIGLVAAGHSINVYAGLAVFLIWLIWASVGIARCGVRIAVDGTRTKVTRVLGVMAILGMTCVVVFSVKDLFSLGIL